MGDKSGIEWTNATWNPIVGCSIVSPGCTHCYAMKMAHRIEMMGTAPHYAGTTRLSPSRKQRLEGGRYDDARPGVPVWTGKLAQAPDSILTAPLRWKRPRRIFVNSMSDLFHEKVPDAWIDRVFAVMALCPQHTFQVLTKRSKRMRDYMTGDANRRSAQASALIEPIDALLAAHPRVMAAAVLDWETWPRPNIWLGVSTEDQARADERIPDLLATPAAVRFISAEPLLGHVDLTRWLAIDWQCSSCREFFSGRHKPFCPSCGREGGWSGSHPYNGRRYPRGPIAPSQRGAGLDLVIIGGELGPRARDFRLSWAKSLIEQCQAASVPAFMKQVGSNAWDDISYASCTPRFPTRDRKGGSPEEWPASLQVREMPA